MMIFCDLRELRSTSGASSACTWLSGGDDTPSGVRGGRQPLERLFPMICNTLIAEWVEMGEIGVWGFGEI